MKIAAVFGAGAEEGLTGPLRGYDPSGRGAALFAFFARTAEFEREPIRQKSLEGPGLRA
ncbi:hypothetical protein ACIBH1_38000 [Nonomuraea sp. NPDC050663]|uniref:hypothetical protein n=1 Tax=Nonomuraea sp. NPDC050663 TaxID=3364370 RepID=UPI00378EEB5D